MCVYLLHFDRPYVGQRLDPGAKKRQIVSHYIGYTQSLADRIEQHRAGNGARLVEVITQAGIGFVVARTWPDAPKAYERQLKNRHNAKKFCPVCSPHNHRAKEYHA